MKTEFENLPDLQEAYEAVKGKLFGPLDPALVKLKHREIIQDAKEKREQEFDPRGRLGLARDDHAERDRRDRETRTLTWLLANNPAYAKLYNDTFDLLGEAEAATDRAIAKAEAALKEAQEQLEQTLSRAATLPCGTRVFRDARGQVWNERGGRVSDADAAGIEWRGDEPAYEQFVEERKSASDRLSRLEELQGYRVDTLGRIRDRMTDQNNTASSTELKTFRHEMQDQMPDAVRAELAKETPTSIAPTATIDVVAPIRTF